MEQLNQQHLLELNQSLRQIQDSFDDAVSETGSEEKAIKIIRNKFLNKENLLRYKIAETERLVVYVSAFDIYESHLSVNIVFLSKFSLPSFKKGKIGHSEIKLVSFFSKKADYQEWLNFGNNYYKNTSFQDIYEETNIKLNQLDIEKIIQERDRIAEDYLNFRKNGYEMTLSASVIFKEFAVYYNIWGGKTNTYISDIYNHILADFREGNNCDRRFVINKNDDREITITFEENKGKITINFQNATFQEAEEYYQNIEKRIKEIKEMIKLRSKVTKVIKNTQKSLLGILGDVYPFASDPNKFEYPKKQALYDVRGLFEEIKEKGEKRESEVMLCFWGDLMDDIQHDRIEKEDSQNIFRRIGEEDITVVSEYYESKLINLMSFNGDAEEIEKIIAIYRRIHRYFDDDRKEIEDSLVRIAVGCVLKKRVYSKNLDILKTFSNIMKGNLLHSSSNFYNQMYVAFVDIDTKVITDENHPKDLEKYNIFNDLIWANKSPKLFMKSVLAPIFVQKIKEDMITPSIRIIKDLSIDIIKDRLSLVDCEFYKSLFKKLSKEDEEEIIIEVAGKIVDIIIFLYKDSNFAARLFILSKYKGLWKYVDMDTKEKFVKEILSKTISEQAAEDMEVRDLTYFEREDIERNYEIYRNYMTDEYIDFYIGEVMKVRKF